MAGMVRWWDGGRDKGKDRRTATVRHGRSVTVRRIGPVELADVFPTRVFFFFFFFLFVGLVKGVH